MGTKVVDIAGVGEVKLQKHLRSRRLRLRITPAGAITVTLPRWATYDAAVRFVLDHRQWISDHRPRRHLLRAGDRIGREHTLIFQVGTRLQSRVSRNRIVVSLPPGASVESDSVQQEAQSAARRALRAETKSRLVPRLELLATELGYRITGTAIKAMTTRWGSCSTEGRINLSIYLAQLPDELSDYVLIHELAHTVHANHSPQFWAEVAQHVPQHRQLRTQLRRFRPVLLPNLET